MSDIVFSREEKGVLVAKLQRYFDDELSVELGQFDGEFLLRVQHNALLLLFTQFAARFVGQAVDLS